MKNRVSKISEKTWCPKTRDTVQYAKRDMQKHLTKLHLVVNVDITDGLSSTSNLIKTMPG